MISSDPQSNRGKGQPLLARAPATRSGLRGYWLVAMLPLLSDSAVLAAVSAGPSWPPPPAEPYVVYVRSISRPADIGAKPAVMSRLTTWVTGTDRDSSDAVRPFGLALDQAGNLLVTDTEANSVSYLDRAKKKWLRWESAGKTRFRSPVGIARHGSTFFVADSALGKVIAFDEQQRLLFEMTRELERPSGLALHGERLFVADAQRHQIVVFDVRGQFLSKFGRRGSGPGEFNFPTHVNVDAGGRILVTDSLNYRIQVFNADGSFLRIIGSAGDGPGHFGRPKGVAVDQAGHIYVADALFDNVQIFDGAGRLLLTWGETGSEAGMFWMPNAIAISRANEIYVADTFNHRIQVFQYTGRE
jgi:DNA-binding beta-propeller fold protein YncE